MGNYTLRKTASSGHSRFRHRPHTEFVGRTIDAACKFHSNTSLKRTPAGNSVVCAVIDCFDRSAQIAEHSVLAEGAFVMGAALCDL